MHREYLRWLGGQGRGLPAELLLRLRVECVPTWWTSGAGVTPPLMGAGPMGATLRRDHQSRGLYCCGGRRGTLRTRSMCGWVAGVGV